MRACVTILKEYYLDIIVVATLIFFAGTIEAQAASFIIDADYGNSGTQQLIPTGMTWVADAGGGLTGVYPTCTFFNEDHSFNYVSGNCTASAVAWFTPTNGHGSGGFSGSTQNYQVVAWYGTFIAGTLVDDDDCYGGTLDQCQDSLAYIQTQCFAYNGSTGCTPIDTNYVPPDEGGGTTTPEFSTTPFNPYNPAAIGTATSTCTKQDSSTTICVTQYPIQITTYDFIFTAAIIIFFLATMVTNLYLPKIKKKI